MNVSSLDGFSRFGRHPQRTRAMATVQRALRGAVEAASAIIHAVPAVHETADELFERAAAYEATQPSYAADLRAAAHLAQSRHFGGC
jgi:predicted RNA-binding Zn ribbon-like protein